ncbi:MAG: hypothetical protein HQK88_01670 [Nitrospirae bacterium]|nr:hypothetical protein [Nitrospirota bacterium]MBF0615506.1 hypothetical protein [Nitrospirota bacterium]
MTSKKEDILNTCILSALAVVIFLRAPILLTAPRFYDEDGWCFFKYAYENSFFKSLFVVHPHKGYLDVFLNISAYLSSLVPLTFAPAIFAFIAFFVQLIPLAIVLWGRSFFFDTYLKKIITTLITIFVISTGDMWIAPATSQYFLFLAAFLILVSEVEGETKFKIWAYRLLLLIAGFAGIPSCYLTPIFILRAFHRKCREHTIHAAIQVFTSVCQIAVIIHSYYTTGFPQRFNNRDLHSVLSLYLVENYMLPIFGYTFTQLILSNLIYLIFVVPVAIYLIWLVYKSISDLNRRLLVIGITFCSIMLMLTSMDIIGGARYAYAPGVMLMVLILSYVKFNKNSFLKVSSIVAFALTVTALTTSMAEYRARMKATVNEHWPDWRTEIAIWEKDPNHPIKLWPQFDDYKPVLKLSRKSDK